jgi:hypothetical protein
MDPSSRLKSSAAYLRGVENLLLRIYEYLPMGSTITDELVEHEIKMMG